METRSEEYIDTLLLDNKTKLALKHWFKQGYNKALEDIENALTGEGTVIFRCDLIKCLKELVNPQEQEVDNE